MFIKTKTLLMPLLTRSSLRCQLNSNNKRHQKVQDKFNLESNITTYFFVLKDKEKLYKPNTGYIAEEDADLLDKKDAAPAEQMKIVIRG
jgi:hypothetical protein